MSKLRLTYNEHKLFDEATSRHRLKILNDIKEVKKAMGDNSVNVMYENMRLQDLKNLVYKVREADKDDIRVTYIPPSV